MKSLVSTHYPFDIGLCWNCCTTEIGLPFEDDTKIPARKLTNIFSNPLVIGIVLSYEHSKSKAGCRCAHCCL